MLTYFILNMIVLFIYLARYKKIASIYALSTSMKLRLFALGIILLMGFPLFVVVNVIMPIINYIKGE